MTTSTSETFFVRGPFCFGRGFSVDSAIFECLRNYSRALAGPLVDKIDPDTEYPHVGKPDAWTGFAVSPGAQLKMDDMGTVTWDVKEGVTKLEEFVEELSDLQTRPKSLPNQRDLFE